MLLYLVIGFFVKSFPPLPENYYDLHGDLPQNFNNFHCNWKPPEISFNLTPLKFCYKNTGVELLLLTVGNFVLLFIYSLMPKKQKPNQKKKKNGVKVCFLSQYTQLCSLMTDGIIGQHSYFYILYIQCMSCLFL